HGWPASVFDLMLPRMTLGGPDEVGEQLSNLIAHGLDGITLNLVANAHDPDMIALAAQVSNAALG
ncbi:MAG TPA: hypothetical protein PLV68_04035, partial [Ilumatobacteraceae bacterium]|nr:hypothetical protein [Ilumatobacteraceae bacterium]